MYSMVGIMLVCEAVWRLYYGIECLCHVSVVQCGVQLDVSLSEGVVLCWVPVLGWA